MDDRGIAIELLAEFKVLCDDPDFPSGPLQLGQSAFNQCTIFYKIRDDRFFLIRARMVEPPTTAASTF